MDLSRGVSADLTAKVEAALSGIVSEAREEWDAAHEGAAQRAAQELAEMLDLDLEEVYELRGPTVRRPGFGGAVFVLPIPPRRKGRDHQVMKLSYRYWEIEERRWKLELFDESTSRTSSGIWFAPALSRALLGLVADGHTPDVLRDSRGAPYEIDAAGRVQYPTNWLLHQLWNEVQALKENRGES